MNRNITWEIHMVCDCKGKQDFHSGMCDAHTHGLNEYGSQELQFVLHYPPDQIAYILNEIGLFIANGRKLKHGDKIAGLLDDEAELLIYQAKDSFDEDILRVIMPDGEFKYPEESEEYPYNLQYDGPYIKELC